MRSNLILVRAGNNSLHPLWLDKTRSFDLVLSYFGDQPEKFKGQYDVLHRYKGSKWEGISNFFSNPKNIRILKKYDYVWLPDDDLLASCSEINRFFELVEKYDLALSQPSLKDKSYISWQITLQRTDLSHRVTDFVEIMAPCFRVRDFSLFSSTFSENKSGFGLEWLWSRIASEANLKLGIIDEVGVFHTRPVGSGDRGIGGINPNLEQEQLFTKHGLTAKTPEVIDALKKPSFT